MVEDRTGAVGPLGLSLLMLSQLALGRQCGQSLNSFQRQNTPVAGDKGYYIMFVYTNFEIIH